MKGLWNLGRRSALQGLALFALSLSAVAAQTDGFMVRVTPNVGSDTQAPAVVADLSAQATTIEGQIMLTWTAPFDLPSATAPAAGYEVFYATFSAAVAGSTTAWRSVAFSTVSAFAPLGAGSPETFFIDGLTGGTTYFFAVRSRDAANNFSDLDANTVSGTQASAFPRSLRPAPVAGLLAIPQIDTSVDLIWNLVEFNEDGSQYSDPDDYVVRRSTSFNGPFSVNVSSGAGPSSAFVSLTTDTIVQYLLVSAVDQAGNESDPALSNILEMTPAGIVGQIAMAQDGTESRTYVPSTIMDELAERNLLMRMAPNTDPVVNRDPRTLVSYDVSFVSPVQDVDKNFTLSRPAMNVVLQSPIPLAAGSAGVLWWNGTAWIKVGAVDVNDITNTVSFFTALPGTYQVRVFQTATSLTLDKASVFPRIFSPNGDGLNDRVIFAVDNPNGAPVDGKIYDVGGNELADLRPAGAGAPTADSLAWDGRDRNGTLARAGVYIYRIKGEGKSMTGTVVVAK